MFSISHLLKNNNKKERKNQFGGCDATVACMDYWLLFLLVFGCSCWVIIIIVVVVVVLVIIIIMDY